MVKLRNQSRGFFEARLRRLDAVDARSELQNAERRHCIDLLNGRPTDLLFGYTEGIFLAHGSSNG